MSNTRYGLTCELPIAIIYQNPSSYAPQGIPLYPTQLFHILWDLVGFGILWALRKKLRPDGSLFLTWLIFFGAGDFVIRFFRENEVFMFNLPQAQLLDILIVATAAVTLIVRFIQYKRVKPATEAQGTNMSG